MDWTYNGVQVNEIDPCYVGFIYVITNIINGRKYYGKKKSTFKRSSLKTVTLKNGSKKKRKCISYAPSDWNTYYGSCSELNDDVEKLGSYNFTREIIRFCSTLSELSYYEAKIQFETDCLLHPDKFYNGWIFVKVRGNHLR